MKNARAVKQFTHVLDGLQGGIALYRDGIDEFLVREALVRSEELVREAKYDEAQALVLNANIQLSRFLVQRMI